MEMTAHDFTIFCAESLFISTFVRACQVSVKPLVPFLVN